MLYEPSPTIFNPYVSVGSGIVSALARFAFDLVRRKNEPWAYYVGYGFGGAALATGIPGAALELYVVGKATEEALEIAFETTPGAQEVEVFLDGVLQSQLDLSVAQGVLNHALQIPGDGATHSIMIVGLGAAAGVADPTHWLSILGVTTDLDIVLQEPRAMDIVNLSYTIRDGKASTTARVRNVQSVSVALPLGSLTLTDLTAAYAAYATAIDNITAGVITGGNISISATLPGTVKSSAAATSDVQEGGLFTFSLSGSERHDSIRVPALSEALFDGAAVIHTDPATQAFLDLLVGNTQINTKTIKAVNPFGLEYVALTGATKSFRK